MYAVGIMTYEWLSGHLPFQGTPAELIGQHMMEPPGPISGIAQAIQDVVFRALAKDPKQRQQHFQSVAEYAQAFRRACGLPAPSQRGEASSRPVQNRPQDRPPVPAIVSPARNEASSSRPVRDQLAEMRLQDRSDRSLLRNPEGLTLIRTLEEHTGSVHSVVLSKDGNTLFSASDDKTIKVWMREGQNWQCRQTLKGHTKWVNSVVPSADGNTLYSASGDGTIKVWMREGQNWQCRQTLEGHTKLVNSVVPSADGNTLFSASGDKTIRVWMKKGQNWQCRQTLEGHTGDVNSVVLSADGNTLFSAGGEGDGTIKMWKRKGQNWQFSQMLEISWGSEYHISDRDTSLAISKYNDTLVSTNNCYIRIWFRDNPQNGRCSDALDSFDDNSFLGAKSLAISADGKTLVCGCAHGGGVWDSGNILIWVRRYRKVQSRYEKNWEWQLRSFGRHPDRHVNGQFKAGVNSLALSADGKTLVSAGDEHTIKIWEIK